MPAQGAALAANGPLYPAERNAHQQERAEVCYHECATAVLGSQPGETQEVAETNGATGYCQHHAQVAAPILVFGFRAHNMRRIIRAQA